MYSWVKYIQQFQWIKYSRCVSLYTLNPIDTMCTILKFKCIFRSQFSSDAVGRRRPALRLRSFPRGCPPQAKIFSKKIKIDDFLYEIDYFHCVYLYILIENLCISWKIHKFFKSWKIFENFWKILKIFWSKIFEKKKKNFDKKIEKNVKKKFLKILTCYIPFCSEFNSEQNERCE